MKAIPRAHGWRRLFAYEVNVSKEHTIVFTRRLKCHAYVVRRDTREVLHTVSGWNHRRVSHEAIEWEAETFPWYTKGQALREATKRVVESLKQVEVV